MSTFNINNIKEEIVHALRNGNILTTTVRGVTTYTENVVATAGQTTIILSKAGARNIRSLTINSTPKNYMRDFTVNWSTNTITLLSALSLSDAVAIQYDYGSSDKIYPDYPRDDLTLNSFPRVAVEWTSTDTQSLGLGGLNHISSVLLTVYAWIPVNKDTAVANGYGGTNDMGTLLYNIRNVLRTNAKSFVNFPYIEPKSISPIIKSENNKLIQQSQDFNIRFIVE